MTAFRQLCRYMAAAAKVEPKGTQIFGVLAAPRLGEDVPRPDWFAFWPLNIRSPR